MPNTKNIKVEEHVYFKLEHFRDKRETFSQAIDRLLTLLDKVGELRFVLENMVSSEKARVNELGSQKEAH